MKVRIFNHVAPADAGAAREVTEEDIVDLEATNAVYDYAEQRDCTLEPALPPRPTAVCGATPQWRAPVSDDVKPYTREEFDKLYPLDLEPYASCAWMRGEEFNRLRATVRAHLAPAPRKQETPDAKALIARWAQDLAGMCEGPDAGWGIYDEWLRAFLSAHRHLTAVPVADAAPATRMTDLMIAPEAIAAMEFPDTTPARDSRKLKPLLRALVEKLVAAAKEIK